MHVFNGRDGEWRAILAVGPTRKAMALALVEQVRAQTPTSDLHYLFAPLKHARLDYMAQKAVEMGAGVLRPILTRRCHRVARLNTERIAANAVEAAEQCGILSLPRIEAPVSLHATLAGWDEDRTLVFLRRGCGGRRAGRCAACGGSRRAAGRNDRPRGRLRCGRAGGAARPCLAWCGSRSGRASCAPTPLPLPLWRWSRRSSAIGFCRITISPDCETTLTVPCKIERLI